MIELISERLRLIPLDYFLLSTWHQEGRNALERQLKLALSSWEIEPFFEAETQDALANFWLPMTDEYFLDFPWYTNWEIVLQNENKSIGGIGLSGMPDQDGVTMIGYFLDKKYRQKGYATEALKLLIEWAATDFSLKTIIADTPVDNIASQNVLKKAGFTPFGLIEEVIHIENITVKHWRLDIKNK